MKLPACELIPPVSKFCLDEWQDIWDCCEVINSTLFTPLLALSNIVNICLAVIPYYSIDSELVTVVSLAHTWSADILSAYLSILRNSTDGETY